MASDILIVDDEADIRDLVAGILQDEGHGTRTAGNSDEAIAAVTARRPNLVFLDIWLQGSRLDGLQLLDSLKQEHPDLPVVMISGHGNIETAVSAIKRGAYDFIEKPFKADRLLLVADRTLENSRLKREVRELRQLGPLAATLVGHSPAANQLRQTVEKVGPTNSRVLIVGPSGSGKELAARTIHALSARANGPFVVINAAAIIPEQMETELFGIDAGNGTQQRKVGALEEAHGGTLFIDEIADMPRETQNKILRVLLDQTFQRVGGSTKVTVDVRIVSSTSRNIESEIVRASSATICITAFPSSRSGCRRWPNGVKTSRNSSTISCRKSRRPPACPSAISAPMRWRCCSLTIGPAMCGSFATTSNG